MSQLTSRLTKTLALVTKKIKLSENKAVAFGAIDRVDKYNNTLLSSSPRSPKTPEDSRYSERLGHWKSLGYDFTKPVSDKYYSHERGFKFHTHDYIKALITITFLTFWIPTSQAEEKPRSRVGVEQPPEAELKYSSLLPLRTISSLCGKLSSFHVPSWLRPTIYGFYCDWYRCDMSEALDSDYKNYRNMSEFFTRRLKSDTRPISREPGIVSPADGMVLHIGPLRNGILEDVKQIDYSVQAFLGLKSDNYEEELGVNKKENELFNCIIYLGPGDCHRFHSPSSWIVNLRKHFPGRLYSVKPSKLKRRPDILETNERVCYMGSWSHGFFSMTAVGATNVGSIKVNFDEVISCSRFSHLIVSKTG